MDTQPAKEKIKGPETSATMTTPVEVGASRDRSGPSAPKTFTEEVLSEWRREGLPVVRGRKVAHQESIDDINRGILEGWLPKWIKHAAQNYYRVLRCCGITDLFGSASGVPAIIVGIGPSLDDEVDALRLVRDNAVLIATDAALRPLGARGITPHIVVTYDAKPEQASLFEGCDTSRLVLVASTCSSPITLDLWSGKKVFYNIAHRGVQFMDLVLPTMFPHVGAIDGVGTVGNVAFALAEIMGCSTIIGVGMDLCYKKVGDVYRYRCQDFEEVRSGDEVAWRKTENKLLYDNDLRLKKAHEVEIKGKTFMSDGALDMYRRILMSMIGASRAEFVDCSPGGSLQDSVRSMRLRDAMTEFCSRTVAKFESTAFHLARLLPDEIGR